MQLIVRYCCRIPDAVIRLGFGGDLPRHFFFASAIFVLSSCLLAQTSPIPQSVMCQRYSDPVVPIYSGGEKVGTGFIVSGSGFILTARHVILNGEGQPYSYITVNLPDGGSVEAKPVFPITIDDYGPDFAILKVETGKPLPFLQLGTEEEIVTGGNATIIGFPFSAISATGYGVSKKFCLEAGIAATESVKIPIQLTVQSRAGTSTARNKDVSVDVVYFQGPSVKGLSGSPIISRDSGRVIGIVSIKLTGLGQGMQALQAATGKGLGRGIAIAGLDPGGTVHDILDLLDNQLANGLGGAIGIDDPKEALYRVQNRRKRK